jgi:hypothetical protein
MKQLSFAIMCFVSCTFSGNSAVVSIGSFNSPYTQGFNDGTLDYLGTDFSGKLPSGWQIWEVGTGADGLYKPDNGSDAYNNTFSYGTSGSPERALGMLRGSSIYGAIGLCVRNDTGSTITTLAISYVGEQWRLGNANRPDYLNFEYSFTATSVGAGTWTPVSALSCASPNTTAALGPLNGNLAANQRLVTGELSGLSFEPGKTLWLRWLDFNASGIDDGLAVDDFSLTAVPEPVNVALGVFAGLAVLTATVGRTLRKVLPKQHSAEAGRDVAERA